MRKLILYNFLFATLILNNPVFATEKLPVEAFGRLPVVADMNISPDGKSIVYLRQENGEYNLVAGTLVGGKIEPTYFLPPGEKARFNWVRWTNNDRLLISFTGKVRIYNGRAYDMRRLLSVDKDGRNPTQLLESKRRIARRLRTDDVIHMLPDEPDHILVGYSKKGWYHSEVYKLNVRSGAMQLVIGPPKNHQIYDWYADWDGNIRYGYGWDEENKRVLIVRDNLGGAWIPLNKNELFEDGRFRLMGVGFDDRTIFVLSSHITGREMLFRFDLTTGELAGKVFEHDEVDLNGIVVSEARRKAVAVSYTLDQQELHYLDPDYERFRRTIDKALPDTVNIVANTNHDESRAIIYSSSDQEPGTYYIYDTLKKTLDPLAYQYPDLLPDNMAPMKRVDYEARDSLIIPAYLTIPQDGATGPRPAIILPHGGPWARDSIRFDFMVQFLANRGYVVLQPNFRGSTGFGDRYEALGYGAWGRSMQDDITDGTRWLIKEGIADPDRICIMGASYGGYAALMGVAKTPELYKCAIAFAPVTDFVRMLKEDDNYYVRNRLYQRVAGGLSKKELARISPIKNVKEINAPVLLLHAEDDNVVPVKQSQRMAKALRRAKKEYRYVELEEGGHSLVVEKERIRWLRAVDEFLAEHLPSGLEEDEATSPESASAE